MKTDHEKLRFNGLLALVQDVELMLKFKHLLLITRLLFDSEPFEDR